MPTSLEPSRDVTGAAQPAVARGAASIVAPSNNEQAIRILVVSDDARFRAMLSKLLAAHGYDVVTVGGAVPCARRATYDSDAAIVDAAAAHGSACWLHALRATARVPTIAIANAESGAVVAPLWNRVDVVLRGPFDARKLLLVIRGLVAVCRRVAVAEQTLTCGPLILHSLLNAATVAGREISLTGVETRVLRELMLGASTPVPRDRLTHCSLGRESPPGDRCLDTHIKRLRRKIGPDRHGRTPIRTVRSVGYLLVEQWQPASQLPPHSDRKIHTPPRRGSLW